MTFLEGKISIFAAKISDDLLLVIDHLFQIFPDFPDLCYVKCHILSFPHKKNTFLYSVHTFTRIRQHYTSLNIGGTNAWAVPPTSNLGGTSPPAPPVLPPRSPSP